MVVCVLIQFLVQLIVIRTLWLRGPFDHSPELRSKEICLLGEPESPVIRTRPMCEEQLEFSSISRVLIEGEVRFGKAADM